MKSVPPKAEHVAFMDDLKAALGHHTHLDAMQMLAVTSQFVGNLIAMQDQRRMTPEMAMEIVLHNIEVGNQAAILRLAPYQGQA